MAAASMTPGSKHSSDGDKGRRRAELRPCDPSSTSSVVGGPAMALDGEKNDDDDDDADDDSDKATGDDVQREIHKYAEHVVDTLRCAQCKQVLESPVLQASCGERWHQSCFKTFKLSEANSECPVCDDTLEEKVWRDVFAERELGKLLIYCSNEKFNCVWIGQKISLLDHLVLCEFQQVECANGCQKSMLRKNLTRHLKEECQFRMQECPHCKVLVQCVETENHLHNCLQLPIECPNGCQPGHRMPRQELNDHLKQCKYRTMRCPILDCTHEVRHDKLHKHFEEHLVFHISTINQGFTSIQKSASLLPSTLEETIASVRQELTTLESGITMLLGRASGTEDQLAELSGFVKIKQQETLESCYQAVDGLQREFRMKAESADQQIRVVTERLLNLEQIATVQAAKIQELEKVTSSQTQSRGMSLATQQLFTTQDKVIATHDILLAEHGLRIDMMDCKNTNGVLLWKITDVSRRRRDAESGKTPSIYSQPFYTTPNGYKLCARLYLNGDGMGKGTHLSFFIVLMRGEYDTLLQWPFQQKVTLILIDQDGRRNISDTFRPDPNSSSFKRPTSELNVATGCPLFVTLATLDGGGYIKDNSLFIKVVVDLANILDPGAK